MIDPLILTLIDALPASKRDIRVLKQRLHGAKLIEIAQPLGLTRERVRQIVNRVVGMLPDDVIPEVHFELDRICHHGEQSNEFARIRRCKVKRELKAHFATGASDREFILSATSGMVDADTDLAVLSDQDLCAWLYAECKITHYGQYLRCCGCTNIKPLSDFAPSFSNGKRHRNQAQYCRSCNTLRGNENYRTNPNTRQYCLDYQRANKNRQYIYSRRYVLRKEGKLDEMPALPPRGLKDSKIKVDRQPAGFAWWWSIATPEMIAARDKKSKAARAANQLARKMNAGTTI